MAERFLALQREQKAGLWRYLRHSRWPVLITAPRIYAGWTVFACSMPSSACIRRCVFRSTAFHACVAVRRNEHLVFDRAGLPNLNLIEKFNCLYGSYGNGVVSCAR